MLLERLSTRGPLAFPLCQGVRKVLSRSPLKLELGVKTDPVQYRFSYQWLFRLMADEGVRYAQIGTFFEIYQLPDEYFVQLRNQACDLGIEIRSLFTAHRELGGFFIDQPGWETVARRNYERLIEVGSLLGAKSVGSNPGAVYRDRMGTKPRGVDCYLRHMKELMGYAHQRGIQWLTVEPMSCLAEPPTLPDEIRRMADELADHHRRNPDSTARVGYCGDVSHGYVDSESNLRHDHLELLEETLPHLVEIHLKNTDSLYSSTFGFGPEEREAGIVDVEPIRRLLHARGDVIPVDPLIGYLEIGGPKLGRDYSDRELDEQLRASLAHLKEAWRADADGTTEQGQAGRVRVESVATRSAAKSATRLVKGPCVPTIRVSPSVMCADLCHLEEGIRQLEAAGADMLHVDMADGHFVPNLLLGMDVVRALRTKTPLPLDVHLMVQRPDDYLGALGEIGVEMVAVHAEACPHLDRTLTEIRQRGMQAGVAINPATPLAAIDYVRERLDYVLLMTVNPGFAGQKLVASGIRKIADCRRWLSEHEGDVTIMVDGNVSFENIPRMVAAGADILVAGTSSWYHSARPLGDNVEKTAEAIADGLEMRTSR